MQLAANSNIDLPNDNEAELALHDQLPLPSEDYRLPSPSAFTGAQSDSSNDEPEKTDVSDEELQKESDTEDAVPPAAEADSLNTPADVPWPVSNKRGSWIKELTS